MTDIINTLNPIITPELFGRILEGYPLDPLGIHGIYHWLKVAENARHLAKEEGIQSDVFPLFAVFHDSRRLNDGRDPDHGKRGASFARELHGTWFTLPEADLERLCYACEHHTDVVRHKDPVIGICWDADRMDLHRVGIMPDVKYLNSKTAKSEYYGAKFKYEQPCPRCGRDTELFSGICAECRVEMEIQLSETNIGWKTDIFD
ncbi:hypothetical protein PDESU_05664 [Pontiella desulfatans]|uniref:HD domain-containing protein n=1 Tax=Pontiella desulfatans TaxID=2750659 RepID=A0A6C2UAY0_PONDE|nr:hypothetical protein [Pontiella desulfatans]VGO17069.1 hypothetical protein PDESU_05664 [Pontiella desulfatans]